MTKEWHLMQTPPVPRHEQIGAHQGFLQLESASNYVTERHWPHRALLMLPLHLLLFLLAD